MKKKRELKFSTLILIIAFVLAAMFAGYWYWDTFMRDVSFAYSSNNDGEVQGKDAYEAQKRKDEEIQSMGFYVAGSSSDGADLIVTGESDAKDALVQLQDKINFKDAASAFRVDSVQEISDGTVYVFQQYFDGIPVYGHQKRMLVDLSGKVKSISGSCQEISSDFDASVKFSQSDAEKVARQYLKSNYQVGEDEVDLKSKGKIIYYTENEEPAVGYLFFADVIQLVVDGNTGAVVSAQENIYYNMEKVNLIGQTRTYQNVDCYKDSNGNYRLQDTDRNIYCYQYGKKINGGVSLSDLGDAYTFLNSNNADPSAVDTYVGVKKAYDYFCYLDSTNPLVGENLRVLDNAIIKENWFKQKYDNAAYWKKDSDGYWILVLPKGVLSNTLSDNPNVLTHEVTHAVVGEKSGLTSTARVSQDPQTSKEYAVNEGLADIFAEFAEYYHNKTNTCDWIHNKRVMNAETGQNCIYDFAGFTEGSTDCHDASTLLSYPVYLMYSGLGDQNGAISIDNLERLWYNYLPQINPGDGFKDVRFGFEFFVYTFYQGQDRLKDKQLESVIDAFDRVGIPAEYTNHRVTPQSILTIFDRDGKRVESYHIRVETLNESNPVALEQDVNEINGEFNLRDQLAPGIYFVTVSANQVEGVERTELVVINDNRDQQRVEDYSDSWNMTLDFSQETNEEAGAISKSVVLVLDASGSMDGSPMSDMKSAAHSFVDTVLTENSQIGISIIVYDDSYNELLVDSNDRAALNAAIDGIGSGGSTNIYSPLSRAGDIVGGSDEDKRIIVLMSDGLPNEGQSSGKDFASPLVSLAESIRGNDEVYIYSLGFFSGLSGDDLNSGISLMERIATPGYYYNVAGDGLAAAFADMASLIRGDRYKKITVACPVDVTVSYRGETLSSAEDNRNIRTSFGSLSFVQNGEEEEKILRILEDVDCDILVTGTGDGTMDYSIQFPDKNGDYTDNRSIPKIPIKEGTLVLTDTNQGISTRVGVDSDGDGTFDEVYTALKNSEGGRSLGDLIYVVIGAVVVLILYLIYRARRMAVQWKRNCHCPTCGRKVPKKADFCPDDGTPIVRVPVVGRKETGKKNKAVLIIKGIVIAACLCVCVAVWALQNSPANTVFNQIREQNYDTALILYDRTVRNSEWNQKYLAIELESYTQKVQEAEKENRCTQKDLNLYYSAVGKLQDNTTTM